MKLFDYQKPSDVKTALKLAPLGAPDAAERKFLAGGTTLVDLMKLRVENPDTLVDITGLPLDKIETTSKGGLKIGAMVRNSDLANHPYIKNQYTGVQ